MPKIIVFHSFYHGVGRSNIAANVAYVLAKQGKSIGLIDADTKNPVQHHLFGLDNEDIQYTFNDYLWGNCTIEQTAHRLPLDSIPGKIFLTPGNTTQGHSPREVREVKDAELLNVGYQTLIDTFNFDALLIDTHPGVSEKALVSVTVADVLVIILRLNQSDYQGTGITVDIVRELSVPKVFLIVNEAPSNFDFDEIKSKMENIYQCEVAAILPHLDPIMALANCDIFAKRYPYHTVTDSLNKAAKLLTS
ncbi:MAG: AAA family ATPase [Anaerolineae bacterium]|nr:AAA family ATPase [Anaerolineae bacterium]